MLPNPSIALSLWLCLWQIGVTVAWRINDSDSRPQPSIMTAALKLHFPAEDDDRGLSLRQAYCEFLLPTLNHRSRKTLTSYNTMLDHWDAFVAQRRITTSNPALQTTPEAYAYCHVSQIDDAMLDAFGRWLMADKPAGASLVASSAETYAKKIRAVLRKLGRREAGNPRGAGMLESVPAMAPISDLAAGDVSTETVDLSDDDIGRIYEACSVAQWPTDANAVLQWQTYVVILAMLGPRVNDGAALTLANFPPAAKSPMRLSKREHEHGWLDYVQSKTGKRVIVPLPRVVRAHVSAIAKHAVGDRMFGWLHADQRPFRAEWQRIVDQAGLGHVHRKHFRPTANLRWTLAANDREVGAMVLGHAAADVNSKHYTRNEAVLLQHVNQVEAPAAFAIEPGSGPTQLFLF